MTQTCMVSIKDCTPNGKRPSLDFYFPQALADQHSWKHKQQISLILDGDDPWQGTVGIKKGNLPYMHVWVYRNGVRENLRDWLINHGFSGGDSVTAIVESPTSFRLTTQTLVASQPIEHVVRDRDDEPVDNSEEFPFSDTDAVKQLAEEYWSLISRNEVEVESTLDEELKEPRRAGYLDASIFMKIARWKSTRPTPLYAKNSATEIEAATASGFAATTDREAIESLTQLHGIGLRTATALLHWMRPNQFPILDFRVVAALHQNEPKDWEDVDSYSKIADVIRQRANELDMDLRTLDRALWTWDKKRK
jgi:thermostable 8-oxoguanine DNA glycosylase